MTEIAPKPSWGNPTRRSRRDWIVDWSCFLLALAFGTLAYFEAMPGDATVAAHVLVIVSGLAGCFILWFRRRWPTGVALGLTVLATFSPFAAGAALIGIFSVAIHRPRRVPILIGLLSLALTPIYFLIFGPSESVIIDSLNATVIVAAVIGWGMYLRARRALEESLRERALEAEADRDTRLAQAREQERTLIAREMHDVLAHRISLVALNAGALEFNPEASPEEVRKAAAVVRSSAHQALDELRDVISILREPASGDLAAKEPPQPTLADLGSLIEECRASGAEVAFSTSVESADSVPDSTGRTAYRVVQEGLTNVRKHAPGGAASVSVSGAPGGQIVIEVSNRRPLVEPVSPTPIPGAGIGLIGLGERVDLAGGRLEYGQQPDGQFKLSAWLPWST